MLILATLLQASLLLRSVQGRPDDSFSYQDDGFEYEEYEDEEEYAIDPEFNPQFTIQPQHFKVDKGHTIRLPCQVDELGGTVISWKKLNPDGSPDYIATSNIVYGSYQERARLENDNRGSTLIITLAQPTDVGEYVCEVSSNPPAKLKHQVSLIVPPTVKVLKPQEPEYTVTAGEEVALVCHGQGDPAPTLKWSREKKKMPDGRSYIEGGQVIFKDVTRKHSGTYVCEGSNGFGTPATDSIKIEVMHAPEIIMEQNYIENSASVKLELVCIVHASPKATVTWHKNGEEVIVDDRTSISHIGRKHLLVIEGVTEEQDKGHYTCHAANSLGDSKGNVEVFMGPNAVGGTTIETEHHPSSSNSVRDTMADEKSQHLIDNPSKDKTNGSVSISSSAAFVLFVTASFLKHWL